MTTEAPAAGLSARAEVARLRLQLRALEAEAAEAEAAETAASAGPDATGMDEQAALTLRSRLDRLAEDRRRALDEDLRQVREQAAARIAAAHAEAAGIVTRPWALGPDGPADEPSMPWLEVAPPFLIAEEPLFAEEVAVAVPVSTPADVAFLRLQLRAALDEADAAEEREQELDADAQIAQLRSKLDRIIGERSAALEIERAEAEAAASASVTDAEAEAAAIVAIAALFQSQPAALDPDPAELEAEGLDLPPPFAEGPWSTVEPLPRGDVDVEAPQPVASNAREPDQRTATPVPMHLDAQTLATVIAVAIVAALEERRATQPAVPPMPWYPAPPQAVPWYHAAAAPPASPKPSFWSSLWHADVILWLVATGIAALVLFAWMT